MDSLTAVSITTLPAGMASQDAERRRFSPPKNPNCFVQGKGCRQKALAELSARLAKPAEAESAWPSLEEEEGPGRLPHSPPLPVPAPTDAPPEGQAEAEAKAKAAEPTLQLLPQTPPSEEAA